MPIRGRTSAECVGRFREHLAQLIAATVTPTHPLTQKDEEDRTILGFRQGELVGIPLDTRFGRLYLYLSQSVRTVEQDDGRQRLETKQYWYRIQGDASPSSQAIVRWEYNSEIGRDKHARHHVHGLAEVAVGNGKLDLNKLHVPTGWVLIEEVIRFLIVDLEIQPPCGDSWPDKLQESETKFYEEFTSKRMPATTAS